MVLVTSERTALDYNNYYNYSFITKGVINVLPVLDTVYLLGNWF